MMLLIQTVIFYLLSLSIVNNY